MKVEGEALRRPWRRWVSTIASLCALVIALVLMSLADVGQPVAEPVQINRIASGPAPNHQGSGAGLVSAPPTTAPLEIPPSTSDAVAPGGGAGGGARLVAISAPDAQNIQVDGTSSGLTGTTTTTVPSTPTSKPPVTLPGKGGHTEGVGGSGSGGSGKTGKSHKPKPKKHKKHKKHKKSKHKKSTSKSKSTTLKTTTKPKVKKPALKKPALKKSASKKSASKKSASKKAVSKNATESKNPTGSTTTTVPMLALAFVRRRRLPRI